MSKNIFILNDPNDINPYREQANFDSVAISNLDSLINNYYNVICVTCIEKLTEENAIKVINTIDNKLRPGGEALVVMVDKSKICQLFLDKTIDEQTLIESLSGIKNNISSDKIIDLLGKNFDVVNIAKSNGSQTIHLGKKNHENQV